MFKFGHFFEFSENCMFVLRIQFANPKIFEVLEVLDHAEESRVFKRNF
jgi:hypothetical protein